MDAYIPKSPLLRRAGFTLVELMIAIALSLLMVIGVNALFKSTADTVGTGSELLSDARELRQAFETLDADFSGFIDGTSQPVLMIFNTNLPAFRDKLDEKSDSAGNGSYANVMQTSTSVLPDNRNHRIDILSFFSSGQFRRQTAEQNGANASYQSLYTSDKAYIWYGHVRQPGINFTDPHTFVMPGTGYTSPPQTSASASNPNGYYANQWVLGRMAVLLGQPDVNRKIFDVNGVPQAYLVTPTNPGSPPSLAPFQGGNTVYDGTKAGVNSISGTPLLFEDSLVDLAGIDVSTYYSNTRDNAVQTSASGPVRHDAWYIPLITTVNSPLTLDKTLRFACKPWATRSSTITGSPVQMRTDVALSSPAFIHGCSQFIVEFAGDYFEQNPSTGGATGQRSDGVLDFDIVNGARRVRWYGMNRRYDDNPVANGVDVTPVSQSDKSPYNIPLPFEKFGIFPTSSDATISSYSCVWSPHDFQWPNGTALSSASGGTISSSMTTPDDPKYTDPTAPKAVFLSATSLGPKVTMATAYPKGFMPWMIRLIIRVDGPGGHLQDGQTIQYVFNLPHP